MTEPYIYYQDPDTTLWCGRCEDVLPRLPSDSVDLVLTDPPYGVNWGSNYRQQSLGLIANDGAKYPLLDVLALTLRALGNGRHLYVFGLQDFGTMPVVSPVELIWDKGKPGLGDLTLPWGPGHERVLFGVHRASKGDRAIGRGNLAARLRKGSVLRASRVEIGPQHHPAEKPVSILRQMIESSSVFEETVLDPFAGVGSTLVAAKLEGRKSIGIELDERYCKIAASRLSQQMLPLAV